jgi:hypothetical protein
VVKKQDPSPAIRLQLYLCLVTRKEVGKRVVNLVEMDGFGIVYLIENAQQFWLGALW